MKTIKRTITIVLALLLSTTAIFAGCDDKESSSGVNSSSSAVEQEENSMTEHDLVKNGTSEYMLLLPQNPTTAERLCSTEINTFFSEATGLTLKIVNEGSAETLGNKPFISIGKTEKANAIGVVNDYSELGVCGYIVKTVDKNVYIAGNNPGVIYGGYEFLNQQFGYSYYSDKVYVINKNVTNCKLINFDEKDIPDIEYRQTQYGFEKAPQDPMYTYRMRLNDMNPSGVGGMLWHNFFAAIPDTKYQKEHPNWYSPDGSQLCLMRDLKGLSQEMANIVIQMLEKDPTIEYVHIGQEDTSTWCTCSVCSAVIENYNGYKVSTQILFMNKVADLVQPYLDEHNLDVKFTMFAYHTTDAAPVELDARTGEYKLVSEDLKLRDNIYVLYAPIDADYYAPFEDEVNSIYKKNLIGWGIVAKRTMIWIYQENFRHYLVPFDNINAMQANFQLARDCQVFWCYNQAQWNNNNSTGFSHLKAYLSAQLQWDVDADVNKLTEDFFKGYHGDASSVMLELYDSYRDWRAHCYYELGLNGSVYKASEAKHWPYAVLKTWLDKIDEAYGKIEKYKEVDYEKYKTYYDAINLESLAFRYLMLTFNSTYFNSNELNVMKKEFKKDAISLRISQWNEGAEISQLWEGWGLA